MKAEVMTLYEEYVYYWKDFESKILAFDFQTREKIKKNLIKEKNRTTFYSKITEINFGLFFANNGAQTEYEKKYKFQSKNLEPDWTLTLNGQKILNEVSRLNPTRKDQIRNDFESELLERLSILEGSCYLKVNFENEYFDPSEYDLDEITHQLRSWLSHERALFEQITLFKNISFKIKAVDSTLKNIIVIGNNNSVDIDLRRLISNGSEFIKKVNKYADFIEETKMPFIISLYSDVLNGIDELDLFHFLYGSSIDDRRTYSVYSNLDSGLFYNNNLVRKYLSGVLLKRENTVTFFYNYYKSNLLNEMNVHFLKKYQFTSQ
ncbi:hypothetical protein [Adhaeribacter rhizoryzae]|uniref:Uncharacterized protein n=1 Tax=Adhaeribacter rhizoryzae TaxID=2607907 RepID=A0A5M6DKX7_9BACT|nr:hypothetical protein [Adhaeribacter rhizoryzae]KAA5548184.1 hypothetical protein F0145_05500 [Adhaeribacter rhizoryzae]